MIHIACFNQFVNWIAMLYFSLCVLWSDQNLQYYWIYEIRLPTPMSRVTSSLDLDTHVTVTLVSPFPDPTDPTQTISGRARRALPILCLDHIFPELKPQLCRNTHQCRSSLRRPTSLRITYLNLTAHHYFFLCLCRRASSSCEAEKPLT